MRRRITVITALIALMALGSSLAANAQGVRFVTPTDGDTVRDIVRVQATKPNPDEGWISYKIYQGDDGDFVAAATPPFTYVWDTRARDADGNSLYTDGQYTIKAVALNPSGQRINEAEIKVTVRNAVAATDAPREVKLQLSLDRNTEVRYRADGNWSIRPAAGEETPEDVWKLARQFDGALVSNWKHKVMSPTYAAGHAIIYVIVGSSGAQVGESEVRAFDLAGRRITYRALRDGELRRKHSDDPSFSLAEMTVPIPDRPVKPGDSWQGRINIWPDPLKGTGATAAAGMGETDTGMDDMMYGPEEMDGGMGEMGPAVDASAPDRVETRSVQARHTLEGFEWVSGYPTARIRSTYRVDDDKITIPVSAGASAGMGEEGMADEMGGMPEEMGMGPGPGGEGMGAGAATPEQDTSYTGERITYWSWDLNRPIRIIDTITHTLEIDRPQVQTGMELGEESGMDWEMDPMGEEMMEVNPRRQLTRQEISLLRDQLSRRGLDLDDLMEAAGIGEGRLTVGRLARELGVTPQEVERQLRWGGGMGGPGGMAAAPPPDPMKVQVQVKLNIQEVGL